MADDWIKMRMNLQSHPKVVRILSAMRPHDVRTATDKFRVIGGLHAVWCVFDEHSEDGVLHGYTPETLDHIIGWDGFANAMLSVEWLEVVDGSSLIMPEFLEHNGKSAKRRAEDAKRKKNHRNSAECPQNVRKESGQKADKKRTREEKSREEISNTPPNPPKGGRVPERFDEFWSAYPKKVGRKNAMGIWERRKLWKLADVIIRDVRRRAASDGEWARGFTPNPTTYLNGDRWEDQPQDQSKPQDIFAGAL